MSALLLGDTPQVPLLPGPVSHSIPVPRDCRVCLGCSVSHEGVTVADRSAPRPQRDGAACCQALQDTGAADALWLCGDGGSGSEPCSGTARRRGL